MIQETRSSDEQSDTTTQKTYYFHYVHDIHAMLDGVMESGKSRAGFEAIVESLNHLIFSEVIKKETAGIYICLGGDIIQNFRCRKVHPSNASEIWSMIISRLKGISEEIGTDIVKLHYVFGNHELDDDFEDVFYDIANHAPDLGCTRNIIWNGQSTNNTKQGISCPLFNQSIPRFSYHCPADVTGDGEDPFIFTGMVHSRKKKHCRVLPEVKMEDIKDSEKEIILQIEKSKSFVLKHIFEELRNRLKDATNASKGKLEIVVDILNSILHNGCIFDTIHRSGEQVPSSLKEARVQKTITRYREGKTLSLSQKEILSINTEVLRHSFRPILNIQKHLYSIITPEDFCKGFADKYTSGTKCPAGQDSDKIHIHFAHYGDEEPKVFGRRQSWFNNESYGRPHVILKSHDHFCTPHCNGRIHKHHRYDEEDHGLIPTFEAGYNGRYIGNLKLTLQPQNEYIEYDWDLTLPGCNEPFSYDLGSIDWGKAIFETDKGYSFSCFGGDITNYDLLFRSVMLQLIAVSKHPHIGDDIPIITSPCAIRMDSRVPQQGDAGTTIDEFDLCHVYGPKSSFTLNGVSGIDGFCEVIEDLFGKSSMEDWILRPTILPPIKSGFSDDLSSISKGDALEIGIHEDIYRDDMRVAPSLCIYYHRKAYLIVADLADNIGSRNLYGYSLELKSPRKPIFCRRPLGTNSTKEIVESWNNIEKFALEGYYFDKLSHSNPSHSINLIATVSKYLNNDNNYNKMGDIWT